MNVIIRGHDVVVPDKLIPVITAQPGYVAGKPLWLLRTTHGGIRLWLFMAKRWMDASLSDIVDHDLISWYDGHDR